jgi:hypothetical protein
MYEDLPHQLGEAKTESHSDETYFAIFAHTSLCLQGLHIREEERVKQRLKNEARGTAVQRSNSDTKHCEGGFKLRPSVFVQLADDSTYSKEALRKRTLPNAY